MKKITIFFLEKQKEWYSIKIKECEAFLKNLDLLAEYVGVDFEYKHTDVIYFENQLHNYLEKRFKVTQKIQKLKQR